MTENGLGTLGVKKPQKWSMLKVWCLVDSSLKYVFNFEIYCMAHHSGDSKIPSIVCREVNVMYNMVMRLLNGQEEKAHVVFTLTTSLTLDYLWSWLY